MSLLCLILGIYYLPKQKATHKNKPKLALSTYLPLLKSSIFRRSAALGLSISACYFIFVGFAPILYREDMHVSLQSFGIYQGALASAFGIMCFCSEIFYKWFGKKRCFKVSLKLYALCGFLAGIYGFFPSTDPFILTTILIGSSIACAIPIRVTYPIALGAVSGASARASGLMVALRLLFSATGLQTMAYFYNHTYLPLALMIGIEGYLAWTLGQKVVVKR